MSPETIRMADNSVSMCIEQHVVISFKQRPKTSIYRHVKCPAAERHFNGVNVSRMAVIGWFRHTCKYFYAKAFQACWDKCTNVAEEYGEKCTQFPLLEICLFYKHKSPDVT